MSDFILPEPPDELKQLSELLQDHIRQEIKARGSIPFSRYMDMALYQPGLGYYSAGLHKLGKDGDFVTAPELGSLFATCLARQTEEVAKHLGAYDILEVGAGSGRMAADILNALPPEQHPRRYWILERSADLRDRQQRLISERAPKFCDRVAWLDEPPRENWKGILLANEVLDALAIERFRLGVNGVEQVCVGIRNSDFVLGYEAAPPSLQRAIDALGLESSEPYVSEINLHLHEWLQAVIGTLQTGIALFIDYGYPRTEYYRPDRSDGTLMCHYRHLAHGNAFFWPGVQDITAFVDFTALAEAADNCGFGVLGYTSQAMFLLGCGLDGVLAERAQDNDEEVARLNTEVRRLTLPGEMGERFQVMALGRKFDGRTLDSATSGEGIPEELRGFSLRDLRHRL